METLERIINNPSKECVKKNFNVNKNSNFVMCTYWWGSGNQNNNIARPCIDFYESFVDYIVKIIISIFTTLDDKSYDKITGAEIIKLSNVKKFVKNMSKKYIAMIYENFGVENDYNALMSIEKTRKPKSFNYKTLEEVQYTFYLIIGMILNITKDKIIKLVKVNKNIKGLTESVKDKKQKINKHTSNLLFNQKTKLLADIKKILKTKQDFKEEYYNMNIYDILNAKLRYLDSITYNEMIQNWIKSCISHNCNYLVIEYPEFVTNYQLSINAKPLFIKKALDMTKNKSVVYIDGDMVLRQYPSIFDLEDIDFMARGWWIDPRSSYKLDESITYDPYTFETSGGTMFFSQSDYSKKLLKEWIVQTGKQPQKADDRILSLIFNTKKFLLDMKIIQLPIEYLWLTMSYNDRMMEFVYDYDETKMKTSLFIEHPECLTTEDTAMNVSQASTNRQPKFYDFLEETDPVSEQIIVNFLEEEEKTGLESYLSYMSEVQYIDDGNPILTKKKFIAKNPADNEYPLYVVKNNKKSDKHFELLESGKFNRVENISNTRLAIIREFDVLTILELLSEGKIVVYDSNFKDDDNIKNKYYYKEFLNSDCEFLFTPIIEETKFQAYFRPQIDMNKPVCFKPSTMLENFISMFDTLSQMSDYLNYGAYHFISKIRIKYLKKSNVNRVVSVSRRKSLKKSIKKSLKLRKSPITARKSPMTARKSPMTARKSSMTARKSPRKSSKKTSITARKSRSMSTKLNF